MLIDSHVEVTAEIGRVQLTFGELINLNIGTVINLGKPVSDGLPVKVAGISKFSACPDTAGEIRQ